MLRFLLIRPGATDFDDQGRIKGTLDIPMNGNGATQVARTVGELNGVQIDAVYTAPCRSARETASAIAARGGLRVKSLDQFENVDHGLWQGKLIEEVRQTQPRVFRQCQEHPETVCPPGGEPLGEAQARVGKALAKLIGRHKKGVVALVVPEPLASIVRCTLQHIQFDNLWHSELDSGRWELIDVLSENGASPARP
jgi:broad specificity phosphatase PhoE